LHSKRVNNQKQKAKEKTLFFILS